MTYIRIVNAMAARRRPGSVNRSISSGRRSFETKACVRGNAITLLVISKVLASPCPKKTDRIRACCRYTETNCENGVALKLPTTTRVASLARINDARRRAEIRLRSKASLENEGCNASTPNSSECESIRTFTSPPGIAPTPNSWSGSSTTPSSASMWILPSSEADVDIRTGYRSVGTLSVRASGASPLTMRRFGFWLRNSASAASGASPGCHESTNIQRAETAEPECEIAGQRSKKIYGRARAPT